MPDASLPDGSLPDRSLPDGSLPDGSLPDASLPDASLPDASLPDGSLPDASLPDASLSEASLSDGSLSDGSLPDGSLPDGSLPDASVPERAPAPRSTAAGDTLREMLRTIGFAAALGLAIAAIFAAGGGNFWVSWLIAAMYGTAIGAPAKLVLPRLMRRIGGMRELGQWFVYGAAMLAIVAVGTAVVGLAMVALGFARLDQFWGNYEFGALISLAIAVPASLGASSYARLSERAHAGERAANEAQLASLESRVRPHFLFNALNSAIALIPEDPARAEDVLVRLSALLRFSLDRQQARLVPLGEELRIVVDYLEIERARFGDRLRYRVEVASALESYEVPAFALQTLVENSVKYAIATRKDGGEIVIVARQRGHTLELEVADDGPGFATAPMPAGHGLDTLRARLAALYGRAATLSAPAPAATGARVLVEVPV